MSLLPEIIFRAVLVRGIRTIRQNTKLLDQLFRNLDKESSKEMREFFRTKAIYIDINYPREGLIVPAIIMLLRSESEATAYLGDSMGYGDVPDEMSWDGFEDNLEVLGGAASLSTLSGIGRAVYGPVTALSATDNTLKISEFAWSIDQFLTGGQHTIDILGGKGVGQQRAITANGRNTVMVKPNWGVRPDNTSTFVIREPAATATGEPRSLYSRERSSAVERLGGLYQLSYQLFVIGPNPEFTIYLSSIVKSILTVGRQYLESQGIIDMKLGATDFVPRTEYQPEFTYGRAITVDFKYPFDTFIEGETITSLRVALENIEDGDFKILSDVVV